ncbi:MAG: hypothetical protein WBE72_23770 [Terracidiphilus sp.]
MHRRKGIICLAALGPLIVCGGISISGCTSGQIVASAVGAVGIVAVTTTVIIVSVDNAHRTLKGCVSGGPGGYELATLGDGKVYALSGATGELKVGDILKVHGAKHKAGKGASGTRDFVVEKINRDYGPCSATPATRAP